MNWIKRIMNKLFIDNESYNIEEGVHISFTGNVKGRHTGSINV